MARIPAMTPDEMVMCNTVTMTAAGPRFFVRLGAVTDALKRIPLAVLGQFQKGSQKFAITRQTLSDIVANFRKRGADTVIDYEHASAFPELAGGQPIPAAGWISALDDGPDADGILWGSAKFTPRAVQMLRDDETRYLSPEIDWTARDKRSGKPQGATLLSAALTLRPFLDGMPAVALSDWQKGAAAAAPREKTRAPKLILADRVAGTVRAVAEDGTESIHHLEGLEAPPVVVHLSDVGRGANGLLDFAPLAEGNQVIASEVLHAMLMEAELSDAVEERKITPEQRGFYGKMLLSHFRELVKSLPAQYGGYGGTGETRLDAAVLLADINREISILQAGTPALDYQGGWSMLQRARPGLIRSYNIAVSKRGARK
jgi:hypothetical protein